MLAGMTSIQQRLRPGFSIITATVVAVIVYGSLYPFGFYNNPDPDGPIRALWATRNIFGSPGNLIANFVLYIPLGFFWVESSRQQRLSVVAVALAVGIALSTFIEVMQFYDAGRYSNMSDIYVNGAGSLFGAIAALGSRNVRTFKLEKFLHPDCGIILLGCWLAYRLFPYAPVINLHKYWDAIKPLLQTSNISTTDIFRHMAAWLAIAVLLETILGTVPTRSLIIPLLAGVLLARILITDILLSAGEVLGGLLGAASWIAVVSRVRGKVILVAALFAVSIIVQAWSPFNFSRPPHSFGWIPFRSFIAASEERVIPSFFEKTFLYGCLVWLTAHAGLSWRVATGLGMILVFTSHWIQIYLPGRSAEITDVILLLIVSAILWSLSNNSLEVREVSD
jgi:VanZ family protein